MEKKSNLGLEIIYWGLLLMTLYVFKGALHWYGMGIVALCLVPVGIALGIWQIIREKKAGEKNGCCYFKLFNKIMLIHRLSFLLNNVGQEVEHLCFLLFFFILFQLLFHLALQFIKKEMKSCTSYY